MEHNCPDSLGQREDKRNSIDHGQTITHTANQVKLTNSDMNTICKTHNEYFENYCVDHVTTCCRQCKEGIHDRCQVLPLETITRDAKYSVTSKEVGTDLKHLTQEFQAIENFLSKMKSSIDDQRKKCLEEIRQVRSQINTHLDTLEMNVMKEISTEYENLKSELEVTMKHTCHNKITLQDMAKELDISSRDGTDTQFFFAVRSTKEMLKNISQSLDELRETDALSMKNISVNVDPTLNAFNKTIESFGKAVIKSTPSVMNYSKTVSPTFAQMARRSEVTISLEFCERFKLPRNIDVTGCVQLPDEKCVLVDRRQNRLVLHQSGNFKDIVTFANSPFDVCPIEDSTVAVTIPNDKAVVYVDINLGKIIKTVYFANECYNVDCDGKRLAIGFPKREKVIVADLEGKEINCFKIRGKEFTLRNNEIYSVSEHDDEVLCYDLFGKQKWTYPDTVRKPVGVAVDQRKYVYVFSKSDETIYIISPYGSNSRIVMDKEDAALSDFSRLCMYPDSDQLFVCGTSNHALVYNVERKRTW
ncbi:unnamed protein product [Mytilus coruscus]|uniref:B box-type domain-containing protein n=1 Tax=Mytilus coruscus TaxID=42192 RepID=A0A6J8BCQ0_MYTCO|nr:unnamed protein product [Mytilus coruscus]